MKYPFFKSIKGKFLLITFALVLITGIGTLTASYLSYTNKLHSSSVHMAESNLQFLSDRLNSSFASVDNYVHWCRTNSDILRFVMSDRNSENYASITSRAKERLDEELLQYSPSSYIQRTVIASLEERNYLQCVSTQFSTDRNVVPTIMEQPYYDNCMEKNHFDLELGLQENPFFPKKAAVFPVILPVYHAYTIDKIGFVYVELSQDLFLNVLSQYTRQENIPVFVTLGENTYKIQGQQLTPVTPQYQILKKETRRISSDQVLGTVIKTENGQQEMISYPLSLEGCYISQPVPQTLVQQQFSSYTVQMLVIFCLILVVGIAVYLFLNRTVNRPVMTLNQRLGKIAQGDFSQDKEIEWENEFGDIGRSINVLAGDINSLLEHRIAYENEKKDYEYKMLQSQINPHFLYNTLNSIKWMAITQGAVGIGEMVTSLSRLLKNIAKGTSTIVTIRDELNLLDDYFLIQKYRYGGSITLEKTVEDPCLENNQIPRFTLQPIIENSIFHGIEPKGTDGMIRLRIYHAENEDVCIDITDNGVGMDEATIQNLLSENSSDKSSFFKDVGVCSVHKRLQYCFGESYGLKIESTPGEFTRVTIRLKNTELS